MITRDDVTAASTAQPEPAEETRAATRTSLSKLRAPREDVRIPIKGVRKSTADAMVRSAFTAPHVSVWLDCDVTATMQLVERLKTRREFADLRVSPLLIVAKAVCLALRRTPELNSFWDEPAQEIVLKSSINLGIATATPRGLLVPNIKGAESLSLVELAAALQEVVTTAREGKTQPADMAGGTFSITNIGVFGVDAGTPILNPGESGILVRRPDHSPALGGRRWIRGADRTALGDHAVGLLRPSARRRRPGLDLPRRRRRHPQRPGPRPPLLTRLYLTR